MNELPITEFKKAIRATHGADATLFNRFRVVEVFQDHPVWDWDGEVLVFNLSDHPTAKTCYAWSVEGRVTTVLHEGPVNSPRLFNNFIPYVKWFVVGIGLVVIAERLRFK